MKKEKEWWIQITFKSDKAQGILADAITNAIEDLGGTCTSFDMETVKERIARFKRLARADKLYKDGYDFADEFEEDFNDQ
jgi:hypothetical protein